LGMQKLFVVQHAVKTRLGRQKLPIGKDTTETWLLARKRREGKSLRPMEKSRDIFPMPQ
jgi:hypothetical protein